MTNDVAAQLKCPTPPNYVFLDIPGLVSEGKMNTPKVRVADLSDEQKDWLAAEWRKELDKVSARQENTKEPAYRGG